MDDEININDVLSDAISDTICDNSNDTICDNSNDTIRDNSNNTICDNSNDTICDNSNVISSNYQSNQHLYPQIMSTTPNKNDQYNNPTDNLELNNESVILNKTKSRTKKKKEFIQYLTLYCRKRYKRIRNFKIY